MKKRCESQEMAQLVKASLCYMGHWLIKITKQNKNQSAFFPSSRFCGYSEGDITKCFELGQRTMKGLLPPAT